MAYELIPGGFRILRDGAVWLEQVTVPGAPGQEPIPVDQRQSLAEAMLAQLQHPAGSRMQLLLRRIPLGGSPDLVDRCCIDLPKRQATLHLGVAVVDDPEGCGELLSPDGERVPRNETFRLPIQPCNALGGYAGPADYVEARLEAGVLHIAWTPKVSGRFVIDEVTINAGLPPDRQMSFDPLHIWVLG